VVQEQLRLEAEAHAERFAELERQHSKEKKQWRFERVQLTNERDGFSGQVLHSDSRLHCALELHFTAFNPYHDSWTLSML
jgi:hypothetical protein